MATRNKINKKYSLSAGTEKLPVTIGQCRDIYSRGYGDKPKQISYREFTGQEQFICSVSTDGKRSQDSSKVILWASLNDDTATNVVNFPLVAVDRVNPEITVEVR